MTSRRTSERRLLGTVVCCVFAAGLLAGPAMGAPTEVDSCQDITANGTYELTADIVGSNAPSCLNVSASDVRIDGNGHVVDGIDAPGTKGINVSAGATGQPPANVTITDVVVTDWGRNLQLAGENVTVRGGEIDSSSNTGVWIDGATNVTLANSSLTDDPTGVYVTGGSTAVRVENTTIVDTAATPTVDLGVSVFDSNARVVDSSVTGAGTAGIKLFGGSGGVRIIRSTVTDAEEAGVLLAGAGGVVRNSTVRNSSGSGIKIQADDAVVTDTLLANNEVGLNATTNLGSISNLTVARTVARNNTQAGFALTSVDGADLESAFASGNRDGVVLQSSSNVRIIGANLSDNAAAGLSVNGTDGTLVRDVTAAGNARGINLTSASGTTFENVTLSDNGEWALYASGDSAGLSATGLALPTADVSFPDAEDVALKPSPVPGGQPAGKEDVGTALNVTGTDTASVLTGGADEAFVFLNVSYADVDLGAVNESSLRLYGHDSDGSWAETGGTNGVDTGANRVYANVTFDSSLSTTSADTANVYAPLGNLSGNVVTDCTTISQSGTYAVDNDISARGTCIHVNASDVRLHGGGHEITGPASGARTRGVVVNQSVTNVTVTELTLRGFVTNVLVQNASNVTVEVTATHGIYGVVAANSTDVRFSGVNASETTFGVVPVDSRNVTVSNATMLDNDEHALAMRNATVVATDVRIRDSGNWSVYGFQESRLTATNVSLTSATVSLTDARNVALTSEASPSSPPANYSGAGAYVNVSGTEPASYANLRVAYDETDVSDESNVSLYRYDGSWSEVAGATVNAAENYVAANVTTFSTFAPLERTGSGGGSDGGNGSDGSDGSGNDETGSGGTGGGGAGGAGGGSATDDGTANVSVVSAGVNRTRLAVGQSVNVTATVRNHGSAGGRYEVELFVDGAFAGESRILRVPAGETERVSVVYAFESAGDYEVAMNGVTAGTVSVRQTEPSGSPTPTGPDDTPTATPTPAGGPGPGTSSPTDGPGDGGGDPGGIGGLRGFGLALGGLLGVVALGGAAYYLVAVKGLL